MCIYIYIYIERERYRDRERDMLYHCRLYTSRLLIIYVIIDYIMVASTLLHNIVVQLSCYRLLHHISLDLGPHKPTPPPPPSFDTFRLGYMKCNNLLNTHTTLSLFTAD